MINDYPYRLNLSNFDDPSHRKHLIDSFTTLLFYYTNNGPIRKWDELELILKKKYHATVVHGRDQWDAIYFDSEEDLVAFKLKWLL